MPVASTDTIHVLDSWARVLDARHRNGSLSIFISGGEMLSDRSAEHNINVPGDRYAPGGSPDWEMNCSCDIQIGTVYNLSIAAYDTDGNYASESLDDDT